MARPVLSILPFRGCGTKDNEISFHCLLSSEDGVYRSLYGFMIAPCQEVFTCSKRGKLSLLLERRYVKADE